MRDRGTEKEWEPEAGGEKPLMGSEAQPWEGGVGDARYELLWLNTSPGGKKEWLAKLRSA